MKKIFYGWYIVAACTILTALSMGVVSSLAVFLAPMMKANGFTRPQVSIIITMYFLGCVAGSLFLGKFVQKSNLKYVVLVAGIIQAILTTSMGYISSLTLLYIIAFVIGIVVVAVSAIPQPLLINNWFKAKKGTAVGTTVAGVGLASLIFGPFLNLVIEKTSYQTGFFVWGGMILVLTLIASFFVYTDPKEKGMQAYGLNPGDPEIEEAKKVVTSGRHLTMGEAIKTPTLWYIILFIFASTIPQMATVINVPSYMKSLNVPPTKISQILLFAGICSMIGKIFVGHLFDRVGMKKAIGIAFLLGFIAMAGLVMSERNNAFFWLYAFALGAGLNFNLIAMQVFVTAFFGAKHYGAIYSKLFMIFSLLCATLGFGSAIMIDKVGFLNTFFYCTAILVVAVIGAYAAMNTEKPWHLETEPVENNIK